MKVDFRAALALARRDAFKTCGDMGDGGDTARFLEERAQKQPVTTAKLDVVTVVTQSPVSPHVTTAATSLDSICGDAKDESEQTLAPPVTTVTTQNAEGARESGAAEVFAAIVNGPCRFPDQSARWLSVVDGARRFADEWAGEALALGWSENELFELDDKAPAARVDKRGLAFLLGNGARVVGIDRDGADILNQRGTRQRYYRVRVAA